MSNEHYLLLNYIKECSGEVHLHTLPEPIQKLFCSDGRHTSLQGAFTALRLRGLVVLSTPGCYKITNKGLKELLQYKGKMDQEQMQLSFAKSISLKFEPLTNRRLWLCIMLTAIELCLLLHFFLKR